MAATSPSQTAPPSPIDILPAEILESILLGTVDKVTPPIGYSESGKKVFRWKQEKITGEASATQFLQIRLVCRKFHAMAWRAFRKVLGETVFDLASKKSMGTLHAIARQRSLSPWMTKLTFSCLYFHSEDCYTHSPCGRSMEEVDWLRRSIQFWNALGRTEAFAMEPRFQLPSWITGNTSLVSSIQFFKNVEEMSYVWDFNMPLPNSKEFWYSDCGDADIDEYTLNQDFCAHVGLEFVVEALVGAKIQPRLLDLAVEFDDSYDVFTYTPLRAFSDLCIKVESLTLRKKYSLVGLNDTRSSSLSIAVTKATHPRLRSLTIDCDDSFRVDPVLSSAGLDLPGLTHLTVINGRVGDGTMHTMLEYYGKHLRRLDFKTKFPQCYDDLFDEIKTLNLETLVIHQGSQDDWKNELWREEWADCYLPWNSALDYMILAKEVILEPQAWRECWEKHWYSQGGENIEPRTSSVV